ncbi:MAG: hypothetical protein ACKVT1_02205 [Dehalococcoidia bacterium]
MFEHTATGGRELRNDLVVIRGDLLLDRPWPAASYVNSAVWPDSSGYGKWGQNKIVAVRQPAAIGEVTIRGIRIDAPGEIRFAGGHGTTGEMVIAAGEESNVTGMLVPASGCYRLTITAGTLRDSLTFDTVLKPADGQR